MLPNAPNSADVFGRTSDDHIRFCSLKTNELEKDLPNGISKRSPQADDKTQLFLHIGEGEYC